MKADVSSPFRCEIFFKKTEKVVNSSSALFYRFLLISGYSSEDFVHHS